MYGFCSTVGVRSSSDDPEIFPGFFSEKSRGFLSFPVDIVSSKVGLLDCSQIGVFRSSVTGVLRSSSTDLFWFMSRVRLSQTEIQTNR